MSLAKRLERCARRSVDNAGWGTRHFLTLSIPRAAYPTQRPTMPAHLTERLGKPDGWGGFNRFHGDGTADRDVNAARNIHDRAFAVTGLGRSLRGGAAA